MDFQLKTFISNWFVLCIISATFLQQISCFLENGESVSDVLDSVNVTFHPPKLTQLEEGEVRSVHLFIYLNEEKYIVSSRKSSNYSGIKVTYEEEKTGIIKIVGNKAINITFNSEGLINATFQIKGLFVGYSKVYVNIECFGAMNLYLEGGKDSNENGEDESRSVSNQINTQVQKEYKVSVIRAPWVLRDIFRIFVTIIICINYVNMGCHLDLNMVKNVLKKPGGVIVGFFSQYTVMPLCSYAFGYLLFKEANFRFGVFILGCSPGGSSSNFWTLLLDGDVNLSVTMTFFSSIAAIGMMPLWLFILGRNIIDNKTVEVPFVSIVTTLLSFMGPLLVGMLVRHFKPKWAEISAKIIRPFTIICLLFIITLAVVTNLYIYQLFTWNIILVGFAIAWSGYTVGWLLSWILRFKRPQIIAISLETAMQNSTIAFLVLSTTLPQPEADLTIVPVVAQLQLTTFPLWFLLGIVTIFKILSGRKKSKNLSHDLKEDEYKSKNIELYSSFNTPVESKLQIKKY
ncbi:ileal sodium/bile acid cotransporter-like [Tachypleus tridentatus]|uniref:ileal sodium/bile acid cotransporter-like n=1 Tax=Tachypleus tridentatus TaxID=6853 RepID=UPI003FD463D1